MASRFDHTRHESLTRSIPTDAMKTCFAAIIRLACCMTFCLVHNTLAAASLNYRRMYWLQKSIHPDADPNQGAAGKYADESAARMVKLLLFENEAKPCLDGQGHELTPSRQHQMRVSRVWLHAAEQLRFPA